MFGMKPSCSSGKSPPGSRPRRVRLNELHVRSGITVPSDAVNGVRSHAIDGTGSSTPAMKFSVVGNEGSPGSRPVRRVVVDEAADARDGGVEIEAGDARLRLEEGVGAADEPRERRVVEDRVQAGIGDVELRAPEHDVEEQRRDVRDAEDAARGHRVRRDVPAADEEARRVRERARGVVDRRPRSCRGMSGAGARPRPAFVHAPRPLASWRSCMKRCSSLRFDPLSGCVRSTGVIIGETLPVRQVERRARSGPPVDAGVLERSGR